MSTTDLYPKISRAEKVEIVLLGFACSVIMTGGLITLILSWG